MRYTLNKTVHIDPKLSANEWQLYSSMEGVKSVARDLNRRLKKLVNAKDSTRSVVEKEMMAFMYTYATYGAYDSEPRWVLMDIMDDVYGTV